MDALEKLIADKIRRRDELERERLTLVAEIDALQLAARLRPAPQRQDMVGRAEPKATPVQSRSGGGRKPGDISHSWRRILAVVHKQGGPVGYDRIADIAAGMGAEITLSSVRDRVRNLVSTGLVEGDPDTGFTVTQDAVERFGFTKKNDPPKGGSDTTDASTSVLG